MKKIRVLIVDDSLLMRRLIAAALATDPKIEIVGEAADPLEARSAIKLLSPDVLTLDVEMPNMDGLSFLSKIMRLRPTPVVMVSNYTQRGADISVRALELGAVECVCKPGPDNPNSFAELPGVIHTAYAAQLRPPVVGTASLSTHDNYKWDGKIVAIGASTGGVEALLSVLAAYPKNCPPTLIAQHMPAAFTRSFAARLNRHCAAHVQEAADGVVIEAGHVYLAPGDHTHLELSGGKARYTTRLTASALVNGHRPSVDVLFHSIARVAGQDAVGVILTGMGRDGADGLLAMRRVGAVTFGQDQATSLIYGMPRSAQELGAVQVQAPLGVIGAQILATTDRRRRAA